MPDDIPEQIEALRELIDACTNGADDDAELRLARLEKITVAILRGQITLLERELAEDRAFTQIRGTT